MNNSYKNTMCFKENSKEHLLLYSLQMFYKNPACFLMLCAILKGSQKTPLRILDWLVTNYSKKRNIVYNINDNSFNMFLEYKNQLKSYSKKYFDPFARRQRIFYTFNHEVIKIQLHEIETYRKRDDGFVTTLAQLNAFRWFIQNKIIEYAVQNAKEIDKDMNSSKTTTLSLPHNDSDNNKNAVSSVFNSYLNYHFRVVIQFK